MSPDPPSATSPSQSDPAVPELLDDPRRCPALILPHGRTALRSELYAIPALAGAFVVVIALQLGAPEIPAAVGAAALCFGIRMLGVRFGLDAPTPPGMQRDA